MWGDFTDLHLYNLVVSFAGAFEQCCPCGRFQWNRTQIFIINVSGHCWVSFQGHKSRVKVIPDQMLYSSSSSSSWKLLRRPYGGSAAPYSTCILAEACLSLRLDCLWLHIHCVPKNVVHLFIFPITLPKVTDFNDFWYVKSWENVTSLACTFAHLTV